MKRSLIALVKAALHRARTFVKDLFGFPVPIDSDYEANTQQALRYLLQPGDVAFDVGANVGLVSVVMSRLVGWCGRIYAFEANPRCVSLLRKTLRLNRIRNCTVIFGAVCDQSEHAVRLYLDNRPRMHGVASSLVPCWWQTDGWDERYRPCELLVPPIKLDEFCGLYGLAPNLVKIDVEGAELAVLTGFRRHLETGKPHIILEARSDGTGRNDDPLHFLESLGYWIAVAEPWRWITADEFSASRRLELAVLAIHRDRTQLADPWIQD